MRKPFGLWALLALLSGLALAQNTDSHTVTVKIPPVLQLSLDATDYLFDFTDATLQGTETVTVGNIPYTKASLAAYLNFLDSGGPTQDFAPTSLGGTTNAYGTVTVLTNRGQWTVKIDSIGGTLTLGNDRVKVFAEKVSGKGSSLTPSPTPIASDLPLFGAGSVGQGKSVYKLYYLFTMDISDDIPLAGLNESITLNLLLSSP
ncbi:hypothetical protein [Thermus sp. NEB1569]|uniref:hypothetical protein n=1 Tax=Thermus sp. NEB1569 TaxID=2918899 RepID=UPI001EFC0E80|nr:hypothetical protein [Thermus sp. NEB1569]ULR41256.1 hypothetical protein MI302_03035 [Thermus sp. NEB1569]